MTGTPSAFDVNAMSVCYAVSWAACFRSYELEVLKANK